MSTWLQIRATPFKIWDPSPGLHIAPFWSTSRTSHGMSWLTGDCFGRGGNLKIIILQIKKFSGFPMVFFVGASKRFLPDFAKMWLLHCAALKSTRFQVKPRRAEPQSPVNGPGLLDQAFSILRHQVFHTLHGMMEPTLENTTTKNTTPYTNIGIHIREWHMSGKEGVYINKKEVWYIKQHKT